MNYFENASITDFFMSLEQIGTMTVRTVNVSIQNTGNKSWAYGVGYSVCGTVSGTDCAITCGGSLEKDLTPQTLTLAPGAIGSMTFSFDDVDLVAGTHYAIVKVWRESVLPLTNCLDGRFTSFTVIKKTMNIYYPTWAYNDVNVNFDVVDSVSTVTPPLIPSEQSSSSNAPYLGLSTPVINGFDVSINGATVPTSGRTVTKLNWDWGDGTSEDKYTPYALFPGTHTYSSVGYFIVTVTTYDNVGDWRKKSLRVLMVTDKTPLQNVKIKCINTGGIKYTDAKGRATFSPFPTAGNYNFEFSITDYKTETKAVNIQTRTLPPDEDSMSQPIIRSIDFGYFDPPVPFTASDDTKLNAPVTSGRYIAFANFPDYYEMVRTYINFSGDINLSSGLDIRFRWYNFDTGVLLFTYQGTVPAGSWSGFWTKAWIGRCSWEIDKVGTYKLVIDFPNPHSGFSGSYGLYFIVK